jgi:hypothetical protein
MKLKLLIALLIFSSCKNEQKSNTSEKYEIHTVENKYQVLIPESLNKTNRLNNLTDFQFENINEDLYIIIFGSTKKHIFQCNNG